ncbi:MAG: T9SS type A sorting domain-containing protein, partial [Bacteroidales bacterium]|nr:T9SS type A sorting domain-containing protein [Bacteroidales bacterium]
VAEEGFYYIGFHCYSAQQMFNLYVDDIAIDGEYNNSDKLSTNNEVLIYPNPTSNNITIDFCQSDFYSLIITDINGKTMLTKNYLSGKTKIDINSLNTGVYLLRIDTGKRIFREKIVKI